MLEEVFRVFVWVVLYGVKIDEVGVSGLKIIMELNCLLNLINWCRIFNDCVFRNNRVVVCNLV